MTNTNKYKKKLLKLKAEVQKKIIIYSGCMRSSKTSVLILDGMRYKKIGKNVLCFKLSNDDRGEGLNIVQSRNGLKLKAISCTKTKKGGEVKEMIKHILSSKEKVDVILIDEIQFWNKKIAKVLNKLAKRGIKIKAYGLDMYATGKEWETTKAVKKIATKKVLMTAKCETKGCKSKATRTSFIPNTTIVNKEGINVGDKEYIVHCVKCWLKEQKRQSFINRVHPDERFFNEIIVSGVNDEPKINIKKEKAEKDTKEIETKSFIKAKSIAIKNPGRRKLYN